MKSEFKEQQSFRQKWLWILLIGLTVLFVFAVVKSNLEQPEQAIHYFLISIPFLLLFLFVFLRLDTKIDKNGIFYKWHPFSLKNKHIKWDEIDRIFVRKYAPLTEYGGWGVRYNFKGWAHNVSGNTGIQIILKSGKRILIGTQKPDKVEQVLEELKEGVFQ